MASRYPSALDDVDNLVTVKDNLTNIGGDLFNRLRDSILAIERALGINIQGTFSDLASRLAVIINPDGSINKQAFQAIGGVFGPIRNDDIDPNAKIAETKLSLNYPTALLQDEIRNLDARNAGLIDLIISANAGLQEHVSRATGAHRATAIATDVQTTAVQSSVAALKIDQSNVQLVLQQLYAGHINFYPGINSNLLTLTNSPHQANQIFYDNRNTELPTNSVQGAIDNLFLKGDGFITEHQRQLHSNGIQRRVERVDTDNASGVARGRILISAFSGRIQYPNTSSDTSIFVDIPIQQGAAIAGIPLLTLNADGTTETIPIDVDDSLQITDPLSNQYALLPITDLKINPVTDPNTNITTNYLVGINVFYNPDVFSALFNANSITSSNPVLVITGSVYQKIDVAGNANALNCIARVLKPNSVAEPNLSSAVSQIQVAHPNAATIISKGFNASALARRTDGYFDRNFSSVLTMVVDGYTYQVQIVPNSPIDITLDTCVAKANLEFLKQNIPVAAYRLGQEMAITHNWPDDIFIAGKKHTIRILSGGGVDASAAAGFSYIVNTTVYGSAGNSYIVDGVQRSTFRIKIPLQGTAALGKGGFTILGSVIVLNDAANNPLQAGVRQGDLVNLQGLTSVSSTTKLDGVRRINDITSNTITVDGDPFPIDVQLDNSATLVVYSNIVSLDNLAFRFQTDFAGLDPNLAQNIVVQVFMNSAGELDFHERLIYPNAATVSGPQYSGPTVLPLTNLTTDSHGVYIIDCSRGLLGNSSGVRRLISFQFDNKKRVFATFGCQSSQNDGYTISSSLHGPPVNITGDGKYQLIDETGLEFITIQSVRAFNLLSDTVLNPTNLPDGKLLTYVLPIVKFEEVNEFENLLLCNVYYNSQINEIPLLNGDLALTDKRYSGTMGAEQIRDDVVERYISGPMGETRGSGVVAGMFVPSDPNATQNITNDRVVYVNGGVVYVQGVRYEISSQQIYVDPNTLDVTQYGTDGYFPGTGTPPSGDGTYKNGYIKYYVFVDHVGRLQTTSRLNLPASLPFVPLARVTLITRGLLNNSPNIVAVDVRDFRKYIAGIDDKMEIVVGSIPQQPADFYSITSALEYVDNLRYNDIVTGSNLHVRPTIIRLLEGVYQEATTMELPPYVTIRGESSRSVRIRPPANLLATALSLADSADKNRYIFNINVLPEGISAKIENICFDCNVATTSTTGIGSISNVGAIKVTWFNNTSSSVNIPAQLSNAPSVVDIKDCLFLLDGPYKTKGITTVFGVATPLITGGLYKFSFSYHQLYSKIYFDNYYHYKESPYSPPPAAPQPPPPPQSPPPPGPPPPPVSPLAALQTGPHAPPQITTEKVLQINPKPPFIPEDAIFTDPNAPVGYNHGGIMNITNNTFVITDGYASICIDRFYDTTTASGYTSLTPIPVSNTRMRAFKVTGNVFHYNKTTNSLTSQITIGPNGVVNTTTPVNTNPASGFDSGQESLRDQMYDLMIHRDLRGFAPYLYPNGGKYPDPKDGYGIPDGYNVPPAGGKVTEFMVIAGNTPTGLNIPEATPVRFASESLDSIARDQHGGGVVFGTARVPATGLPIVLDRSMDWHDRYVFIYITNALNNGGSGVGANKNLIYSGSTPISHVNSGISFIPAGDGVSMNSRSIDSAAQLYGGKISGATHAFTYGFASRLSGDLVTIQNPTQVQLPGWSQIKYLGTVALDNVYNNSISFVVMPNGELAALHAGVQDPAASGAGTNAKLVQTSDSYPGNDTYPSSTTDSAGYPAAAAPQTLAYVIQYSPRLNVLTSSQFDSTVTTNNLDNTGKGFGKI